MTLLIKVVFIYLILLISPEQKVQTFNMPGDKSNLYVRLDVYFIYGYWISSH